MFDALVSAFRSIGRKKGRSFLTMLGIAIGVGSVTLISNISQCGTCAISEELDGLGMGSLAISANIKSDAPVVLGENELETVKKTQHVLDASPIIMKSTHVTSKRKKSEAILWGVNSQSNKIISINSVYGRFIDDHDVKTCKSVCIIDQGFAKEMYGRENVVGKKIEIALDGMSDEYSIVGIIKTGSGILDSVLGEYVHNFIYMPYTTLQSYTGRGSFDQIVVRVDDSNEMESIGENIIKRLNVSFGRKDSYHASNLAKQRNGLTSVLNIITLVLSAVSVISLVVASLSIMTVMLVSVSERTREIGIKKSIGANNLTIMYEFLLEALVLTLLGSVSGFLFGTVVSMLGTMILKIKFYWNPEIMIASIVFAMISGILFGIYPAYKASRLKPVDALRTD